MLLGGADGTGSGFVRGKSLCTMGRAAGAAIFALAMACLTARAAKTDEGHHCSGHGATSLEDKFVCTCMSGYSGPDCSKKSCPRGVAWADYPTGDDVAHAIDIECSGQGYCDTATGNCACRDIFEGPACDVLACPTSNDGIACSGHGACATTGWAAKHWNGNSLIRPNVTYTHWDAEKVRGCLCDDGSPALRRFPFLHLSIPRMVLGTRASTARASTARGATSRRRAGSRTR